MTETTFSTTAKAAGDFSYTLNPDDILDGGIGRDTLTGGPGKDTFLFVVPPTTANVDRITDFISRDDTIVLSHVSFAAAGVGPLRASAFYLGTKAHDANDRLIYNQRTGYLAYDPDGSGAHAAYHVATLTGHPTLTYHDIKVT